MYKTVKKKISTRLSGAWQTLGPGLITGAADDDPSGIATYSQTGATYGNSLLWLSLFTFPLMAVVQEMCARIGMVSGRGLAANIKKHYSHKTLWFATFLLLVANTFNIGADLGAMAASTRLIFPGLDFIFLVTFFGIVSIVLQIFVSYGKYSKYLKYLSFVLFSYIFVAFYIDINWSEVIHSTFVPNFIVTKQSVFLICAILGTTISPYLFFWQSSQEVEEGILKGEKNISERINLLSGNDISKMRKDVWIGMFFSNFAMFFIIVVCAATLFSHGITNIDSASDAANALRPFAGDYAFLLFALGIIGLGMLSVPVLAGSSAYAMAESFNWKFGLYRKFHEAIAFYSIIIISGLFGILINFLGFNVIQVLIYSAILNGLIAPIIIYFVVGLCSDKKIMGRHVNGPITNTLGYATILLLTISAIAALVSLL